MAHEISYISERIFSIYGSTFRIFMCSNFLKYWKSIKDCIFNEIWNMIFDIFQKSEDPIENLWNFIYLKINFPKNIHNSTTFKRNCKKYWSMIEFDQVLESFTSGSTLSVSSRIQNEPMGSRNLASVIISCFKVIGSSRFLLSFCWFTHFAAKIPEVKFEGDHIEWESYFHPLNVVMGDWSIVLLLGIFMTFWGIGFHVYRYYCETGDIGFWFRSKIFSILSPIPILFITEFLKLLITI